MEVLRYLHAVVLALLDELLDVVVVVEGGDGAHGVADAGLVVVVVGLVRQAEVVLLEGGVLEKEIGLLILIFGF